MNKSVSLHRYQYSLDHEALLDTLSAGSRLLIIQDLDGVCMGLVKDPLRRQMRRDYVRACKKLEGEFFVLTNGEHVGSRGVNGLVEAAFEQQSSQLIKDQGLYLPGLAAGGVQLQNCYASLSHPGVSQQELDFLAGVPERMLHYLNDVLASAPFSLEASERATLLSVIVLDNLVSPTLNIGTLFDYFQHHEGLYAQCQRIAFDLLQVLMSEAEAAGLDDSFFVHLAPNLGEENGQEILKPAVGADMGTTDFQFMLRGAIKEVGVLVLLNLYYFQQTGRYPLGEAFNARTAPRSRPQLLDLATDRFDPAIMPRIIGVGDTVTSSRGNSSTVQRGGSDRGFLTLVQELGRRFESDNSVIFVDSSRGELNRAGVNPLPGAEHTHVPMTSLRGITDSSDSLVLNFLFPGGHDEYTNFFMQLADRRR